MKPEFGAVEVVERRHLYLALYVGGYPFGTRVRYLTVEITKSCTYRAVKPQWFRRRRQTQTRSGSPGQP